MHVSDCGDNPQPPILLLRLSLLYSVYAPTSDFSFTLNITAKRLNLPSWAGITLNVIECLFTEEGKLICTCYIYFSFGGGGSPPPPLKCTM